MRDYKEQPADGHRYLDEDVADIDAVRQQFEAMQRMVRKMRLTSGAGRRWQQEVVDGISDLLHDTSTAWLVERGQYLQAIRRV